MISAQRVKKLLLFLCKHMPAKDVETMKSEIEEILGYDVDKASKQRRLKRDREIITANFASARIAE